MLTIHNFFSPSNQDLARAFHEAAKKDGFGAVKNLGTTLIEKTIEDEVAQLFDIGLVGLMLRAWKKYDLVRKHLGQDARETSETVLVPLLNHTIESTHNPYIQISKGGVPVLKIKFSVQLVIAVEGLVLKLGSGRIQEVTASRLIASGNLKCEGVTIVEKKSQPLNLPGTFVVSDEEEAHSQEEDHVVEAAD